MQDLQQQWAKLEGAGPHVMQQQGGAFADALSFAMDAFANRLSERYGVNVKEINWTRSQPEGAQR